MTYSSAKRQIHRQQIARRAAALSAELKNRARPDPKAWAWALRAREEAGERLNEHERRMWREALQWELEAGCEQ
jgi:hypothetical protein